jgi:hypothetical protein
VERKRMSRKVKREISSLPFSLNRLYRRISTLKLSALIVSILAIAVALFLFGGGLYDIINRPLPAAYYQGRFLVVYPQLSEQFLGDSVVSMTLYALGIAGLLIMYQSTKYAYRPRQAYLMFLVGVMLIFISYIFIEATIRVKMGG